MDVGLLLSGAQVSVIDAQGKEATFAEGEAALQVDHETLFRVYCAIKPIAAVAIANLVDAGLLDLDEALCHLLPNVRALSNTTITLRHVLTHTAGLHGPTGVQIELLPTARRRKVLFEETTIAAGWRVGHDTAFSEVLGWHILGLVMERITGQPLGSHLRESVLEPLGLLNTWIGMSQREFDENAYRIGLNYDFREPPKALPMLMERTESICTEVNCAFGGYTTARDLARFYAAIVTHLGGALNPSLPAPGLLAQFCSPARERSYDVVLHRECTFGLGFMCGLEDYNYGPHWSSAAFGHSAWAGSSFGFGDPTIGISVGVITNGLLGDEVARLWRPRLLEAIFADCLGEGKAMAQKRNASLGSPLANTN